MADPVIEFDVKWGVAGSNMPTATMCGCVGPQRGQPLCPCRMRNVRQVDGRWVETIDHGPVREHVPIPKPFNPAAEEGDMA